LRKKTGSVVALVLTRRPASTAGTMGYSHAFIVLLVRRLPIGRAKRPFVRQAENMLQQLYFDNGVLAVHNSK